MTDRSAAEEIVALAEDDPEGLIVGLKVMTSQDDFGKQELVEVAAYVAREGVNIFRVLQDHPETAVDVFGEDLDVDALPVEKLDQIAENAED